MYTFSNRPPARDLNKDSNTLGSANANTALVTKLFMFARPDADMDEFVKNENQREPPSLSNRGKLRQGTKSHIIGCLPGMFPCQQADTRMMLHLYHASRQGHSKTFLRSVDSDVVVLTINIFHQLRLSELWIGYGTGKTYKYISILHISQIKCLDLNIVKCRL